jgi:hypothetical protein
VPADRKLASALRWTAQDRREIAAELYAAKLTVYRDTLSDLIAGYGYDLQAGDLALTDEVDRGLREAADRHARLIVDTYNRELRTFLDRHADVDQATTIRDYGAWMEDRQQTKSEEVAITEAYEAYTDATAAFFIENGLEPEFEFGGGEDDEPPECDVCAALIATNPHPLSRVLEVGTPHIRCRQKWHPLVAPEDLPDELALPNRLAGVVGSDPLNMRLGGDAAAVDFLTAATGGGDG